MAKLFPYVVHKFDVPSYGNLYMKQKAPIPNDHSSFPGTVPF